MKIVIDLSRGGGADLPRKAGGGGKGRKTCRKQEKTTKNMPYVFCGGAETVVIFFGIWYN